MSIEDTYRDYDAVGLGELVANGDVTPRELLDEAARRSEQARHLNAVVIDGYDAAVEQIERGLPDGPLRGVPFLLKDLYVAASDLPMTNGSKSFRDNGPEPDSTLTRRYRDAGLVIFGRTASPEFGLTTTTESELYGVTHNPWSMKHTAGGSSGGAAAIVAAGVVPAANASDGGGSIRIPASCCGLFGLKPARGRVPMGPAVGEGWSGFSAQHVVTHSVRDSAALLDAVAGHDCGDPYYASPRSETFLSQVGADPGRLRIAITTKTFNGAPTHEECVRAAQEAAELCRELGHEVVEAEPDIDRDATTAAARTIVSASIRMTVYDRAAQLGREPRPEDVEASTWKMCERAGQIDIDAYPRAVRQVHATGRRVAEFLDSYDMLLTPTMASPPAEIGVLALSNPDTSQFMAALTQSVGFTQLMNVSGNAAMSVPLAMSSGGLPIGVQFAASMAGEASLLGLAAQLEQARPWAQRRPGTKD